MKNQDNNFKRDLLKELTGFSYKEKNGNTIIEDNDDDDDTFDFTPVSQSVPQTTATAVATETAAPVATPIQEDFSYTPTPRRQTETLGTTMVSRGSVINGGIQTRENITIEGIVNGDISSKGKIIVRGKVEGNISGYDVDISCDELVGDITCESKLTIQANTKIKGNLYTSRATIIGSIDGNIIAKENVELANSAIVYGDIKSDTIAVSEGAIIYGMVTIGKSKPDTSPF